MLGDEVGQAVKHGVQRGHGACAQRVKQGLQRGRVFQQAMQIQAQHIAGRVLPGQPIGHGSQGQVAGLRQAGFLVDWVRDGVAAERELRAQPYAAAVLDLGLPGMDGLEATRAIRRLPGEVATMPILALTANADPWDATHYIAEGMDGVIEKPIKTHLLAAAINAAMDRRRSEPLIADRAA